MPLQPSNSAVHINRPLTNISIAFLQDQSMFVADKVLPNIPVQNQSDVYFTFDRGYFNSDEAQKRAPGTESAGGGYELSQDSYLCEKISFHKDIADEVRRNTDSPLDSDRNATQYVTQKLLIRKEKEFADTFMATSVWTNETSGANTDTTDEVVYWDDYVSSDPIVDVRRAKTTVHESTGFRPNLFVITQDVHDALMDHPDIIDRIKYTSSNNNPAMASTELLAKLFEVKRVVVSGAIQNTATEGATNAHSFIMRSKALLLYVPDAPVIEAPSAGYNFSWVGYNQGMNNLGVAMKRLRMEALESDRIEGTMFYDMKVVSPDLGYFFNNVVEGV